MVYFGYPSGLIGEFSVSKSKIVDEWITEIDREFGFIMIMEHFDLSLAVLVGIFSYKKFYLLKSLELRIKKSFPGVKLGWSINDLAYVKLNNKRKLKIEDRKI